MKGKGTWIAVVLFFVLGAWVTLKERGEVRQPGEAPPLSEMVGMKAEDVTRVELAHAGRTLVLAKSGKEWRVEQPIQAKADETQVKQMLDGLLTGRLEQILPDEVKDLKQFGLEKPEFQVTLTDAKGGKKVLQTGVKDPAGSALYARATDRPELFLVSAFSVEEVQKKQADDLRDKTALSIDPTAATKLTMQAPTGTLSVEKQGAKWQMTLPRTAPADADAVQLVLDQLKGLRVEKFEGVGGDLARYGLANPRLTVTVAGPSGEKGLLLGKPTADGKNLFAARQGEKEVFQLAKHTFDDLSKKPGDLRDKTLLNFKRDDATAITIATPARTVELTRSGKEWKLAKPTAAKASEEKLSALLFTMEVVKGNSVVEEKPADLAKYGLDKPQIRVLVALPAGNQELLIGKQTAGSDYYARTNSQEAVFTLPDFTVNELKVDPEALKDTGKKAPAPPAMPATTPAGHSADDGHGH